jgi:ring-1,2-phenylacetyl-CoA epoxidase subunit PaaA
MENNIEIKNSCEFRDAPKDYQELVLHQLRQHAEGELIGAEDYLSLFYPMAPNAFERKVCCERAAEELDHFIRAAEILNDIGFDCSPMLQRNIQQRKYYKTEGVEKISSWLMRGFFSMIGEAAVLAIIEEMAQSSYVPLADMTRQVIIDEYVHVAHGQRIVEKFINEYGAKAAQSEFELSWAMTLDLFGDSNSVRSKEYVKWGLRKYSNHDAREIFIAKFEPRLIALGLLIPPYGLNRKFL